MNPQLPRPLLDVLLPQMTLRFALVLNGEYDGLPALALREGEGQERDVAGRTTGLNDAHLRLHRFAKSGGAHLCRPPCQRKGVLALMPYGESDDWLLSLPLFHVSGQGILWRWLQGGGRLTVRENSRLSRRYRAVPTPRWCQRSCGDCLIHTIPSR